jgi:hypothetical protein
MCHGFLKFNETGQSIGQFLRASIFTPAYLLFWWGLVRFHLAKAKDGAKLAQNCVTRLVKISPSVEARTRLS